MSLAVRDGQVLGTINGVSFSARLSGPSALPSSAYLYLGAYLEDGRCPASMTWRSPRW
ncbi:hypothetical protein ACN28S_48170 [Cystobacter fuscus]